MIKLIYNLFPVRCSYEFALVVRTSSRVVRTLFVRCSYEFASLFVRCSYAVRTSANSPANYATRPSACPSEPEGAHKAHGKAVTQAKNDNPALRALPTASVL